MLPNYIGKDRYVGQTDDRFARSLSEINGRTDGRTGERTRSARVSASSQRRALTNRKLVVKSPGWAGYPIKRNEIPGRPGVTDIDTADKPLASA